MGFHCEDAASRWRRGSPLSAEASYGLRLEMKRPSKLGHYGLAPTNAFPAGYGIFPVPEKASLLCLDCLSQNLFVIPNSENFLDPPAIGTTVYDLRLAAHSAG